MRSALPEASAAASIPELTAAASTTAAEHVTLLHGGQLGLSSSIQGGYLFFQGDRVFFKVTVNGWQPGDCSMRGGAAVLHVFPISGAVPARRFQPDSLFHV